MRTKRREKRGGSWWNPFSDDTQGQQDSSWWPFAKKNQDQQGNSSWLPSGIDNQVQQGNNYFQQQPVGGKRSRKVKRSRNKKSRRN